MKRNLLMLALFGVVMAPAVGLAVCDPLAGPQGCPAPTTDLLAAIQILLNVFFWALVVIAIFFIMLAAFYFVTGGGDPGAQGKAMSSLRNAVIGIIIALLALGIAKFAAGIFG